MTINFTSKKTFIAAICGVIGIFTSILGSVLLHQHQQYQSTHLASLAYLDAALHELTTFTPKRLVSDESSFQRFRELNGSVVTRFQRLKYGNDALGVSAISPDDGPSVSTLLNDGENLLSGFGKLIQSRQDINQYRQYNQQLLSEANSLVQATEAVSAASKQQNLSPHQMKALGDLTLLTKALQYDIKLSLLSIETHAESLISNSKTRQQQAQSLIQQLTASNTQLSNPVLRRMIVNIADQLNQHLNTVLSLSNATNNYDALEKNVKSFTSTIKTLLASVNKASDALSDRSYMTQLTVTLGALIACLSFFFTGLWIKEERSAKKKTSRATTVSKDHPSSFEASSPNNTSKPGENTQQRKQIITEKNQLIHDIQPIVDGVFYVDANEYAETTGEIAKAFNGARRSIVKRLQLIQQEVTRLQHLQQSEPTAETKNKPETKKHTEKPTATLSPPSPTSTLFDIKSCVDITFETQTKIEQIKRLYSTNNEALSDSQTAPQTKQHMTALMECQDHLRVRLRDLQMLVDQHFANPTPNHQDKLSESTNENSHENPHESKKAAETINIDLERLSRLVHSFQLTEVPRSRKMRKPTPQPAPSL